MRAGRERIGGGCKISHRQDGGRRCGAKDETEKKRNKKKGGETSGEGRGKTHRPIVPAGRQPKSRPLIRRSNIRGALGWLAGWLAGWLVGWLVGWLLGWLVGWLVGRRQRSAWREEDAKLQSGVRERYEKRWARVGQGRVGGLTGRQMIPP